MIVEPLKIGCSAFAVRSQADVVLLRVLKSLERREMKLPLDQTRVPVGPSMGRVGSRYMRGQVDKACLEILDRPEAVNDGDPKEIAISLVAELAAPYAVFLRNNT